MWFVHSLIFPSKEGVFVLNKSSFYIYTYVINLTKGETSEKIIVTLNELKTLASPYYLFVFTHITTKSKVSFVTNTDESPYPDRYNQFDINTQSVFGSYDIGEWNYKIYEQSSSTNTDESLTTSLLEYGKMILNPASAFSYDQYDNSTTYKVYNG